jgi:hypothetical protein
MSSDSPVTNSASSEARNAMAAATSSGGAALPRGASRSAERFADPGSWPVSEASR